MSIDPRPAREWPIPWMDKEPGWKDTAFTWAMGRLILQRIADGETMKAITADPRMPAYCTVYRWMRVVPEFGDLVAEVRWALSEWRRAEREAARKPRRPSGRKSTYDALWAEIILEAIENGESLSEALSRPGTPSFKAWYRWLRTRPEFAAAYVEACRRRSVGVDCARDEVIEASWDTGIPAANAALRALEGRRGRMTPRLYRWASRTHTGIVASEGWGESADSNAPSRSER